MLGCHFWVLLEQAVYVKLRIEDDKVVDFLANSGVTNWQTKFVSNRDRNAALDRKSVV